MDRFFSDCKSWPHRSAWQAGRRSTAACSLQHIKPFQGLTHERGLINRASQSGTRRPECHVHEVEGTAISLGRCMPRANLRAWNSAQADEREGYSGLAVDKVAL